MKTIILRLSEDELKRLFLFMIAPPEKIGKESLEAAELIAMLCAAAGRSGEN